MGLSDIRTKYLAFMESKGHALIPSAPLIPQDDPTTLFTGSGMQPMLSYLLGTPHPQGNKIADSQKCFRSEDIEEVGDNRHTTFFEMLGNWSLGSYWKEEQLSWFYEFLTSIVGINPERLYVSVFSGDRSLNITKDDESVAHWQKLFAKDEIKATVATLETPEQGSLQGMQGARIFFYNAKKNWWSRAGTPEAMPSGEPGGPDSEVFFEFEHVEHDPAFGKHCHPNCDCGRFLEIGNSVFMEYIKQHDGSFVALPQKNVDFGGGLERIVAAANNEPDVFNIDVFSHIITAIEDYTGCSYQDPKSQAAFRVIADHIRAATFMVSDGLVPGNKAQGYFLRRLIRRAAVKSRQLKTGLSPIPLFQEIANSVIAYYENHYFNQSELRQLVTQVFEKELRQFEKTLDKGLKEFEKVSTDKLDGQFAFDLFQTYGFPFEITQELASQKGVELDESQYHNASQLHKQQSRTASSGMFKGGLGDANEVTVKYHTATHLLHQALRLTLGNSVQQMGSNITADRLRFDFTHTSKVDAEKLAHIELLVNQKIEENLPVFQTFEDKEAAINAGALAFFKDKYSDKVSVYTIGNNPEKGWFSKELCGGPHVASTGEIGPVRIIKEKAVGDGIRRIYMVRK
jgi:alanyl-tRNA synthetase